jgi:hypothetical protein
MDCYCLPIAMVYVFHADLPKTPIIIPLFLILTIINNQGGEQ